MTNRVLESFRLAVLEENLGVYGIQVWKEGEEPVSFRWRSDDKVCLYSASKAFTSLGVGICADEGGLRLSDTALSFFPEYREKASAGSEKITVRDLLHMSSGKGVFWFSGGEERMRAHDWAELFFLDPVLHEPGSVFCYSNACTYMLGRIIEKATGNTLRDYLLPRLFSPLGIWNPQWHACPGGHTLGATELYLTLDEFARLGRVLLGGGRYEGRRLVSEGYLQSAVSDRISTEGVGLTDAETLAGYGYQLWGCSYPGAYRADGMYGQYCIVLPGEKAVVTVISHEERRTYDILRAVYREIVPRLGGN